MSTTIELLCRAADLTVQLPYITVGPVSLDVGRGQAVGVMGRSGSGKSTLLRMLALFITPDGGRLDTRQTTWEFPSRVTTSDLVAHRRRIVYVSQENSLWPHLTIRQNIAFGPTRVLKLRTDETAIRTKELLERLELLEVAEKRTWMVSGGEARRSAVARALALEPDVILLDEPESGLDPVRAARQMDLILATCERVGTGVIIVSHNPATIFRATSVIHVLHAGSIVESGPTSHVLQYPSHPETQALLAASGTTLRSSAGTSEVGEKEVL